MPPRKTRLRSSGKPLKKQGATKAKKRDRYSAYLRSAAWKEKKRLVRGRSGGRCERIIDREKVKAWYGWIIDIRPIRCPNAAKEVHHLRYTKIRPDAALEDLQDLCTECHREIEAATRPWNRGRNWRKKVS